MSEDDDYMPKINTSQQQKMVDTTEQKQDKPIEQKHAVTDGFKLTDVDPKARSAIDDLIQQFVGEQPEQSKQMEQIEQMEQNEQPKQTEQPKQMEREIKAHVQLEPVVREKLYLCFSTKSTGINITDDLIAVGICAATDGGLVVLREQWSIKIPTLLPVPLIDEPSDQTFDDNDPMLKQALEMSKQNAGSDVPPKYKYDMSMFKSISWELYWCVRSKLLDNLAENAQEQKAAWLFIASTLISFHQEYPPHRYDLIILSDSLAFDIGMINVNLARHAYCKSIYEIFNPRIRSINIYDINSMLHALSPDVRIAVQQKLDMMLPNDEMPVVEAERLILSYILIEDSHK